MPKVLLTRGADPNNMMIMHQNNPHLPPPPSRKLGHMSSVRPEASHLRKSKQSLLSTEDDASDAIDEDSVLILAQSHDTAITPTTSKILLTQDAPTPPKHSTINSNLVLLDSQSTVDLFTNPALVSNICPDRKTMSIATTAQ